MKVVGRQCAYILSLKECLLQLVSQIIHMLLHTSTVSRTINKNHFVLFIMWGLALFVVWGGSNIACRSCVSHHKESN